MTTINESMDQWACCVEYFDRLFKCASCGKCVAHFYRLPCDKCYFDFIGDCVLCKEKLNKIWCSHCNKFVGNSNSFHGCECCLNEKSTDNKTCFKSSEESLEPPDFDIVIQIEED
jgi:hypothetical protein